MVGELERLVDKGIEVDLAALGRAARSALIASTMHRSSRQASRAAVMKAVAADLIREQRRVISEVVRVPHGDRLYDGPGRNTSRPSFLVKKLAQQLG